jgi:aminocarboxymuconate-semialdehyde decarboxylase
MRSRRGGRTRCRPGRHASDEDYASVLTRLRKRPVDYFRLFFADTALFSAGLATECGLRFFGVTKILFASDAPFDPERGPLFIRETIKVIDALPVPEADRQRIYWRNAVGL